MNMRVVERIIDHKFIDGSVSYLVKWQGYPDEENSWKLQEDIIKYAELLEYYWENFENHPPPKSISKEISPLPMITESTLTPESIIECNSSNIPSNDNTFNTLTQVSTNSETVEVKKKQNEGNKTGRNSKKIRLGENIPRFYEPDWDSHVECIEAIYHDESNKVVSAIIKWKSHELRTLHSIEEVKRRCPQQVIQFYETHSQFKIIKDH